ncbi:MAG: dihydrofolate reductase [Sphingomonadales bacterium]
MTEGSPLISAIVARGSNGVIGKDGDLPWRLPEDLKRFKAITLGKPIIMGRKTWDSLGRPLPGRKNIVLTRDTQFAAEGCVVVHTLDDAIDAASGTEDIMIIGGAEIYRLAMPHVGRIYLTEVDAAPDGDTYFPELVEREWQKSAEEVYPSGPQTPGFRFLVYDRLP